MTNSHASTLKKLESDWNGRVEDIKQRLQSQEDVVRAKNVEIQNEQKKQRELAAELALASEEMESLRKMIAEKDEAYRKLQASSDIQTMTERLKQREKELQATIGKIMTAEETTESALTCMACMHLFDSPVMCYPCGHVSCEKCIAKSGSDILCKECGASSEVDGFVPVEALDILSGKFNYRKQALKSLQDMCKRSVIT